MPQTKPMTPDMMVTYLNSCKTYESQVELIAQRDRAILEAAADRARQKKLPGPDGVTMFVSHFNSGVQAALDAILAPLEKEVPNEDPRR